MIVNRHRGEVKAVLDGKPFILCLTLGALAELEAVFAVDDLSALTDRFATGRLSSRDILRVLGAGLRGAGHMVDDADLQSMQIDGGAAGFAQLVAELLKATFANASSQGDDPLQGQTIG